MHRPHPRRSSHGTPQIIGAVVAFAAIGVALSNPTAASEPNDQANGERAFESIGQLVADATPAVEVVPDLPAAPIAPTSDPQAITALQTRLAWTGLSGVPTNGIWDDATTAAVKRFQWKQLLKESGVADLRTVDTLRAVARDGQLDPRCMTPGIVVCVDKTQKVTRYVKDGQTIRVMDSNYGPEKGNKHFREWSSTREGLFKVFYKKKDAFSNLYGNTMPDFMAFDGGEGFHFSGYFKQSGYTDVTQGCIVTNDREASSWLYDNTPKGTPVVVYH